MRDYDQSRITEMLNVRSPSRQCLVLLLFLQIPAVPAHRCSLLWLYCEDARCSTIVLPLSSVYSQANSLLSQDVCLCLSPPRYAREACQSTSRRAICASALNPCAPLLLHIRSLPGYREVVTQCSMSCYRLFHLRRSSVIRFGYGTNYSGFTGFTIFSLRLSLQPCRIIMLFIAARCKPVFSCCWGMLKTDTAHHRLRIVIVIYFFGLSAYSSTTAACHHGALERWTTLRS